MKPAYKAGLEACKTSVKSKDNCEAGVEFLTCLFANNSEFLFP
uniref:Uncharacterized protein n=1 Tax=Megaselia scalaris TaxID=36166 RepID=T1GZ06_MEGSC